MYIIWKIKPGKKVAKIRFQAEKPKADLVQTDYIIKHLIIA